jgi:hypothetical protein
MKVISFDVGIKNMAYCIFSVDSITSLEVTQWDILSLMTQEPECEKHTCTCFLKKKQVNRSLQPCSKTAHYRKNDQYYCKPHAAEQTEWLLPSAALKPVAIKKLKVEELRSMAKGLMTASASSSLGLPTASVLKRPELVAQIIAYYENQTLESIAPLASKNAEDMDLIQLGRNMTALLDRIETNQITHVIIENQISPIAGRMKTIQGMVAQYFIMKCPTSTIEFISSANKLKGWIREEAENNIKTNYKNNKENSIKVGTKLLDNNPFLEKWREKVKTHKKKDDLFDAFLQAVWYLTKREFIVSSFDTGALIRAI